MIVADITGGLGNQMFIYAAARSVSLQRQKPFKLSIAGFSTYKLHHYALPNFNIVEDLASQEELLDLLRHGTIYRELNAVGYDPKIAALPTPLFLRGYFQSFRYFQSCEEIIRSDFSVKTLPTGLDAQILEMISNSNSVCVHVRRADYVTNPVANQVHGTCPPQYYSIALEYISQKAGAIKLFVFSDDIYWAQENLHFNAPAIYVGHNGADRNFEDLRLMSACKHFVIANSSFSWWGAWLGTHPDKIVCAPNRWFSSNPDTSDLLPPTWIRVQF